MANTTNFGWETPDDTDLVKDGAAAMRTLGNSIDASFVDLKGGTTGQILSKASNTDLDYTWITNDVGDITAVTAGTGLTGGGTTGAVTLSLDSTAVIAPTIVDAKGDIIAATAADTVARLAVGANNTVLTADSAEATGLKWSAPTVTTTFTSFTPVITQSVNVTLNAQNCVYTTVGDLVFMRGRIVVTGSGTSSNAIQMDYPVAAASTAYISGNIQVYDASATAIYSGFCVHYSNKIAIRPVASTVFAYLGATSSPMTAGLASNDEIDFQIWYRKA
jgi:hypothetical protein